MKNTSLIKILLSLSILFNFSCKDLEKPLDFCQDDLNADFEYSLSDTIAPIKVSLVSKMSSSSLSLKYKWYIDSILISTAKDTSFTFLKQGSYNIKLEVINCSEVPKVNVKRVNLKPLRYSKFFGKNFDDIGTKIRQSSDGNYIVCGITTIDSTDMWVAKLNRFGDTLWTFTKVGIGAGEARDIIEARDGSFLVCGLAYIEGKDKDLIVLKISSDGKLIWSRNYGGTNDDGGYSIKQTTDNGFVIAGYNSSVSNKSKGSSDMYLLKISSNGITEWEQHYGGDQFDCAYSVLQLKDQTYILCGTTQSKSIGASDALVVKADIVGNEVWSNRYGDLGNDVANSIILSRDGNYVFSGYSTKTNMSDKDMMIWKIANDSKEILKRTFGGTLDDESYEIIQTTDGDYASVGYTYSFGNGDSDIYLVKINELGNKQLETPIGQVKFDRAASIVETQDYGFMIFGTTIRNVFKDFLVLKTDEKGN